MHQFLLIEHTGDGAHPAEKQIPNSEITLTARFSLPSGVEPPSGTQGR
jgi:hypothetical protein